MLRCTAIIAIGIGAFADVGIAPKPVGQPNFTTPVSYQEVVQAAIETAAEAVNHTKGFAVEVKRREKYHEHVRLRDVTAVDRASGADSPESDAAANADKFAPPKFGQLSEAADLPPNATLGYPEAAQEAMNASGTGTAGLWVDLTVPSLGTVRGLSAAAKPGSGVDRWLGIPYAVPPIEQLRWMPTVPLTSWSPSTWAAVNITEPRKADRTGSGGPPLDGTVFGQSCIPAPGASTWMPPEPAVGEDCLFLNVWAPAGHAAAVAAGTAEPLPVVVYVHGGAFAMGSGANPATTPPPDTFVRSANVVFVSFNYRLGVLGWMVSSALPNNGGLQGLQDQVEVLKWVQAHIRHFGGDPRRVTLQGESAGAISICVHLVLPASRGLFHKAVLQSGMCSFPFEDAGTAYAGKERLAKAVGCHTPLDKVNASAHAAAGAPRRPPRPAPINVITKASPQEAGVTTDGGLGTAVGPMATLDGLLQAPSEQRHQGSGGAPGPVVEAEGMRMHETWAAPVQQQATSGSAMDVTLWQSVSLWLRTQCMWPLPCDYTPSVSGTAAGSGQAGVGSGSTSAEQPESAQAKPKRTLMQRLQGMWDTTNRWLFSISGPTNRIYATDPATAAAAQRAMAAHERLHAATDGYFSPPQVHHHANSDDAVAVGGPVHTGPKTWTARIRHAFGLPSGQHGNSQQQPRRSPSAFPASLPSHRVKYAPPVWSRKQMARDASEMACMRALPASVLTSAVSARRGVMFYEGESWGPIVDGIVLPDHPIRMIRTGLANVTGLDILYGHNQDEASVFVLFAWPFLVSKPLVWEFLNATVGPEHARKAWDTYVEGIPSQEVIDARPALVEPTGPGPASVDNAGRDSAGVSPSAAPSPFADEPQPPSQPTPSSLRLRSVRALNDMWKCASFHAAAVLADHGARVRLYQFRHTPSYLSDWFKWLGAFHGSELDFVLGAFTAHEPQPQEASLSVHMTRLWAEFITGQRLRVQHFEVLNTSAVSPTPAASEGQGVTYSSTPPQYINFRLAPDDSQVHTHPPLKVVGGMGGETPGVGSEWPINPAALGLADLWPWPTPGQASGPGGVEDLLVPEVHVDPSTIHVNDVEWPLYAPAGDPTAFAGDGPVTRGQASEGTAAAPPAGSRRPVPGHEEGVCLQIQAEPGFALSPRRACRPAECALWDATLSHGFLLPVPPQLKEPLLSRLTNVWAPKALAWISGHLPHLNILGIVVVVTLLSAISVPACRALVRRARRSGITLLWGKDAVPASALTTPGLGTGPFAFPTMRIRSEGHNGQPSSVSNATGLKSRRRAGSRGAGQGRALPASHSVQATASQALHAAETAAKNLGSLVTTAVHTVQHALPERHVHHHTTHTPVSVGVYGPAELEDFVSSDEGDTPNTPDEDYVPSPPAQPRARGQRRGGASGANARRRAGSPSSRARTGTGPSAQSPTGRPAVHVPHVRHVGSDLLHAERHAAQATSSLLRHMLAAALYWGNMLLGFVLAFALELAIVCTGSCRRPQPRDKPQLDRLRDGYKASNSHARKP